MTVVASAGIREHILNSVLTALDTSEIRLYSGAVPASSDDSTGSSTRLCRVRLNGTDALVWEMNPQKALSKPAAATWVGNNLATGTATYFRIVDQADGDNASSGAIRIQGSVGIVDADLNLDSTALMAGIDTPIKSFTVGMYAQLPR